MYFFKAVLRRLPRVHIYSLEPYLRPPPHVYLIVSPGPLSGATACTFEFPSECYRGGHRMHSHIPLKCIQAPTVRHLHSPLSWGPGVGITSRYSVTWWQPSEPIRGVHTAYFRYPMPRLSRGDVMVTIVCWLRDRGMVWEGALVYGGRAEDYT